MNPTLAGLLTVLVWGGSALFITFLLRLPALELVTITWFLSFVLLWGYYAAKGENVLEQFKRPLKDYFLVAGGMGGYTALFYIGFKYAPPFEATVINYSWPILLMIFLVLFKNEPLTLFKIIGMVLGFGGCIFLSKTNSDGAVFAAGLNVGHIVMLVAALWWALYSCFTHGKKYPTTFMVPVFLVCTIVTAALHLAFETTMIPTAFEWIFLVAIGLCRMAYALWDYSMRYGNQMIVTSASYFTPLLATLVLIAGGYGAATQEVAVGAVLIIVGCLVVNGDQFKKLLKR